MNPSFAISMYDLEYTLLQNSLIQPSLEFKKGATIYAKIAPELFIMCPKELLFHRCLRGCKVVLIINRLRTFSKPVPYII